MQAAYHLKADICAEKFNECLIEYHCQNSLVKLGNRQFNPTVLCIPFRNVVACPADTLLIGGNKEILLLSFHLLHFQVSTMKSTSICIRSKFVLAGIKILCTDNLKVKHVSRTL